MERLIHGACRVASSLHRTTHHIPDAAGVPLLAARRADLQTIEVGGDGAQAFALTSPVGDQREDLRRRTLRA